MNVLEIVKKGYKYEIDGVDQPEPHMQTEYIVDGIGLETRFGFEKSRPWFGQTCFEMSEKDVLQEIKALRGFRRVENAFGTNRFVLYRCHCGCEECGVLSCEIIRMGGIVSWQDIHCEGLAISQDEPMGSIIIEAFVFDADQYDNAIRSCDSERS